ncbi:hypothetical protein, partial [Klebsiella variicola]|uniref:hypothetical protein n=1 Tax=Klebsiella variicola TaxID=244366 RepID=UPI001BABBA24
DHLIATSLINVIRIVLSKRSSLNKLIWPVKYGFLLCRIGEKRIRLIYVYEHLRNAVGEETIISSGKFAGVIHENTYVDALAHK